MVCFGWKPRSQVAFASFIVVQLYVVASMRYQGTSCRW
jgi:hypothetical protein